MNRMLCAGLQVCRLLTNAVLLLFVREKQRMGDSATVGPGDTPFPLLTHTLRTYSVTLKVEHSSECIVVYALDF